MDEQRPRLDRKTLLLGLIFAAGFILWPTIMNWIWPKPAKPPAAAGTNQVEQVAPVATQTSAPPAIVRPAEAPKPVEKKPDAPRPPEQLVTLSNEFIQVEFTTHGGGIAKVTLLKYRKDVDDPDLVVLNRHRLLLNEWLKIPIGEMYGIDGFDHYTVFTARQEANGVIFEAVNDAGVKLVKEFRLGADYLLDGSFAVVNSGEKPLPAARMEIAMGIAASMVPSDTFDLPYLGWNDGNKSRFDDPSSFESSWWSRRAARTVIRHDDVRLVWGALEDRFFCTIWMPEATTSSLSAVRKLVDRPTVNIHKPRPTDWGIEAKLITPQFTLAAGETYKYAFKLYTGPKEYRRIKALGQDQTAVMHWGWFEWMAEILLGTMNLIYKVVPNYFWVIIILTAIIKVLLWPLQQVSNKSMKAMQALSPKITALREKYKDDPQKMNMEVMKLYREHKINPMMGCLPMVMQFPVFIGLYYMLRSAIELRGHGFLWVHDLSQPDTVAYLFGFALNPLPLVMCATMVWQMRMTPSGVDPMQQKIMLLMPIMFLFFFYGTPSGLVLYWTVQNLFSILQMALTKHASPVSTTAAAGPANPAKAPPQKPQHRTKVKSK